VGAWDKPEVACFRYRSQLSRPSPPLRAAAPQARQFQNREQMTAAAAEKLVAELMAQNQAAMDDMQRLADDRDGLRVRGGRGRSRGTGEKEGSRGGTWGRRARQTHRRNDNAEELQTGGTCSAMVRSLLSPPRTAWIPGLAAAGHQRARASPRQPAAANPLPSPSVHPSLTPPYPLPTLPVRADHHPRGALFRHLGADGLPRGGGGAGGGEGGAGGREAGAGQAGGGAGPTAVAGAGPRREVARGSIARSRIRSCAWRGKI
jgi:hypothetical protein